MSVNLCPAYTYTFIRGQWINVIIIDLKSTIAAGFILLSIVQLIPSISTYRIHISQFLIQCTNFCEI